jgi:serine/threonine protein kinase/class 3 adenylate cyclase
MSFEDYRPFEQMSAGRDGVAYRAKSTTSGDLVALWRLDRAGEDPTRWAAIRKRLAIAARFRHPSALAVLEVATDQDPPFVVVALDERPPLIEGLHASSPLPSDRAVEIAAVVAEALAEAHRVGLIHGGLNPWSITGSEPRGLLLDFTGLDLGRVRQPDASLDAFRAPEILEGQDLTAEADVFALGALILWLLAKGARSDGERELTAHNIPRELQGLATEATAIDPADRPAARDIHRRLLAILASFRPRPTEVAGEPGATGEWSSQGFATVAHSSSAVSELLQTAVAAPLKTAIRPSTPTQLGRYRLIGMLGEGGMGTVYKAEDEADGSVVAVKVLRPEWASRPLSLKRFRKEARLLARIRNPYVTGLLDVNEDQGIHYLVVEYVAGEALDRALAARGSLDERMALAVGCDIARALIDAHRLGIVHRDIKPANILLASSLPLDESGTASPSSAGPRVKLSDFGLARFIDEGESQVITQSGVLVGTPAYMSPEQCSGTAVGPASDVYSLGATLFHLVAGRPPFESDDMRSVIARHVNEAAPPLRDANPNASEGFARVIEKALAKAPESRYPDAEALLVDLERLLRGEPTGLPMHPLLPDAEPGRVLAFDFSWDLDAPPRALWPFVSNTDRLDRALGFGAVRYTLKFDPALGVRRFLEGRKAGTIEAGEEFPYEWVEGRRLGVLREYSRGPFRWVTSVVELAPRGTGTRLTHRLRVEPRGLLVRLGSRWGIGSGLRKGFERVYRRIDGVVTGRLGQSSGLDPFEPPPELPEDRLKRIDSLLAALGKRGVAPEVADRLGRFLIEAPDPELTRIRPIALARRLGLPQDAVIAACLHAANIGLLVLLWDLLCPVCRIPSDVKESMRELAEHGHCEACHLDYELNFASSVELIFRAHPQVRDADTKTYCAAGPAHSPHVVAQVRLAPGERIELDLALTEGRYALRGPQLGWSAEIDVRRGALGRRCDVALSQGMQPGLTPELAPDGQMLGLSNDTDLPMLVRVERTTPRDDVLTAARASSLAIFRELFPSEILAPGRLVSVASVSLLVTALDQVVESLYESLGDARAFSALHEHFRRIDEVVRKEGGALVKAVGEGVLATFPDPAAAVAAGLAIPAALAEGEATRGLSLRAVAHHGPAMAATLNDHLDYFGTTVHQAVKLLGLAPPGSFVLTRAVAADPVVAARFGSIPSRLLDSREAGKCGPLTCLDP